MPAEERNPEIRIDKIPVKGGLGALLAIIVLLGAMLVELPGLRPVFVTSALAGVVLALVLILWRRRRRA
jgi:hypothetical protein